MADQLNGGLGAGIREPGTLVGLVVDVAAFVEALDGGGDRGRGTVEGFGQVAHADARFDAAGDVDLAELILVGLAFRQGATGPVHGVFLRGNIYCSNYDYIYVWSNLLWIQ